MKDIFLDSDVILDLILARKPFFEGAQKILSLVEKNIYKGYTSSLIIANCYYITSTFKSIPIAIKSISKIRSLLNILPFTDKEIGESLNSGFKDFEDGVQYYIAINHGIETFITRNISDFNNVNINVFLPKDFLSMIS